MRDLAVFLKTERRLEITQHGMMSILFGEKNLVGRKMPIDTKIGVVPGNCALTLWRIELIALILEYSLFAQNRETVCKSFADEELPMVVLSQLNGHMTAIGGRTLTDVDSNVENMTFDHPHQFALSTRRALEMQPAENAIVRHGFIVLHEIHLHAGLLGELSSIETLKEIATNTRGSMMHNPSIAVFTTSISLFLYQI